jgi:hypothetical protein
MFLLIATSIFFRVKFCHLATGKKKRKGPVTFRKDVWKKNLINSSHFKEKRVETENFRPNILASCQYIEGFFFKSSFLSDM